MRIARTRPPPRRRGNSICAERRRRREVNGIGGCFQHAARQFVLPVRVPRHHLQRLHGNGPRQDDLKIVAVVHAVDGLEVGVWVPRPAPFPGDARS